MYTTFTVFFQNQQHSRNAHTHELPCPILIDAVIFENTIPVCNTSPWRTCSCRNKAIQNPMKINFHSNETKANLFDRNYQMIPKVFGYKKCIICADIFIYFSFFIKYPFSGLLYAISTSSYCDKICPNFFIFFWSNSCG